MDNSLAYFSDRYTEEGTRRIFSVFDEENTGRLTRDMLRKMAMELGYFLSKDDVDEIFERASSDGENITFEDFHFFMKKNSYEWNKVN